MGIENSTSILVHDLLDIEIQFTAIVSFRNEFSISIASKLLTRMECGMLVPIQIPFQHFPNFCFYKTKDITKQNFIT